MGNEFWVRKCEVSILAMEIGELLQKYDSTIGMAALNYSMAAMIHVHMDGDEEALAFSDQQTRHAAALLTRDRSHKAH